MRPFWLVLPLVAFCVGCGGRSPFSSGPSCFGSVAGTLAAGRLKVPSGLTLDCGAEAAKLLMPGQWSELYALPALGLPKVMVQLKSGIPASGYRLVSETGVRLGERHMLAFVPKDVSGAIIVIGVSGKQGAALWISGTNARNQPN